MKGLQKITPWEAGSVFPLLKLNQPLRQIPCIPSHYKVQRVSKAPAGRTHLSNACMCAAIHTHIHVLMKCTSLIIILQQSGTEGRSLPKFNHALFKDRQSNQSFDQ